MAPASIKTQTRRGRCVVALGMETGPGPLKAARGMVWLGHALAGVAALVVAGTLVLAGAKPNAGLGAVFLGLGLALALAAAVFLYAALLVLRGGTQRGARLSLVLSIVELAVGVGLTGGLVVAVQGYGTFEPWRSPLLVPSALLLLLGLTGVAVEVAA